MTDIDTSGGPSAEAQDVCTHKNLKRDPEKGEQQQKHPDETLAEVKNRHLAKKDKIIYDTAEQAEKAANSGNTALAAQLWDTAFEMDKNLKGERFEAKVADDTNAQETSIKISCKDCGEDLGEFDVVTENGIVKECKSSWGQVNEKQFLNEQSLAQRPEVFGPGTIVHIAVPQGERGRLDRKFKDKSNIAGKIQEH